MKIGILTWFDNLNYGTALQCFALQKYIKDNFDADAVILNYSPSDSDYIRPLSQKKEHIFYKIACKLKEAFYNDSKEYNKSIKSTYAKESAQKKKSFSDFLSNVSFTEKITNDNDLKNIEKDIDLFICGSDQIWNPNILNGRYYLNFVKDKPKIAYAVSFGIGYLPKYSHQYISDFIKDFKAIGLRETTCKTQLKEITSNKNIDVVCDPTFLLEAEYWKTLKSEKLVDGKYFVSYFLGDTNISKKAIMTAEKELGINTFILPATNYMLEKAERKNITYGPAEFLEAIYNTEFVLTDSFHAVCFSLIFEKNFCVIPKHGKSNPFRQNSRIESLLDIVGLSDRFIYNLNDFEKILNSSIDYSDVRIKLKKYINSSKQFLDKNIN